jgi:arginyl-tRNA synthetase
MSSTDPIEALGAVIRRAVVDALGAAFADVDPQVRRSDRADLQADVALGLAKRAGKPPRAIAEAIRDRIAAPELVERIEIAGPGFLNVTLSPAWLAGAATRMASDERLGVLTSARPERVVLDYSHPNVAKEMHVGHLRSTVIGDALARLLVFRGHTVIRQNHIGDWGTPFGMLIEHMLDLGETQAASELAMGELQSFYKAARRKFDEDPAFADRARRRVVALQGGDAETLGWWRKLVDLSARYFEVVYEKLGVTLEPKDIAGESFYDRRLAPLAQELEASGAAKISDGALCIFPAGFTNKEGKPLPLIVRKSDGGYGYATTDLAAIRYRVDELKATRILYVVGAPQSLHLAMVFQAAKELGWLALSGEGSAARPVHVQFGSVLGTDKRMFKSRAGETVRLVDLIDAAIDAALGEVEKKSPDLAPAERAEIARMVGTGAIKYADLANDRVKDYVFDLERMVSFEGNTAGYAQYAFARVRSIFRKAADGGAVGPVGPFAITEPAERALVLQLLGFAAAVAQVEETLSPHTLASYLHAVATAFSTFYQTCPVLRSDVAPEVRASRLALADLTGKTLAKGLSLLGIQVPDRM